MRSLFRHSCQTAKPTNVFQNSIPKTMFCLALSARIRACMSSQAFVLFLRVAGFSDEPKNYRLVFVIALDPNTLK